jgi:hypothetical protein
MSGNRVKVPGGLHLQARFFSATQGVWKFLGNLESAVVRENIERVNVDRPIYVTSLARAGTTILTELLDGHKDVTCHRYSDFPNVWTPYWRNYLLQKTRRKPPPLEERAHRDRIKVNSDSPEAFEEVLWMHFFPHCHESGRDNTVQADTDHPAFENFYRDHICKLLAVRGARRYMAKGNYNVLRLAYLANLFPDLKVIVPYRNPVDHVASLIKQHHFFEFQNEQDTRIGRHLALSGHFEFGPKRKAVNFGDDRTWREIERAWQGGNEVEGWARYWYETYRFLLEQVDSNATLSSACRFISYERLCAESGQVIDEILRHCELDPEPFISARAFYCNHLSRPAYYSPNFSGHELETIKIICQPILETLERKGWST